MNSQVSFVDGHFSLIHIPLPLYPYLLQPILRILLPYNPPTTSPSPSSSSSSSPSLTNLPPTSASPHTFLNISITPLEVSIVCPTSQTRSIFQPFISALPTDLRTQIRILPDPFLVFSVSSSGMEASQRVLDLTSPLAMAGISIFFITTYYTDFILVPAKSEASVVRTLVERGFEFDSPSISNGRRFSTASSGSYSYNSGHGNRAKSASLSSSKAGSAIHSTTASPPSTPPPASVAELQMRTVKTLRENGVRPRVEEGLELVQVSGHSQAVRGGGDYASLSHAHPSISSYPHASSHNRAASRSGISKGQDREREDWMTSANLDPMLYLSLITALSTTPKFLSLTLSAEDPPSLLIDRSLLPLLGSSVQGDLEAVLVPIFLDLADLPTESTGIVCGVAGMVSAEAKRTGDEGGEMSYLSTARAGTLVIAEEGKAMAMRALQGLGEDEVAEGEGQEDEAQPT